jgi:hypothetical protein
MMERGAEFSDRSEQDGRVVGENTMIINPTKSKAVCFMMPRLMEPLDYSLRDIVIPEASTCKYLGIIDRSELSWTDLVTR